MSLYEASITNPKKQLEFYKVLSEQLQREIERQDNLNKQLVKQCQMFDDNWNELKKWLEEEYERCDKIGDPAVGCAMGQIKRIKSKMQELEGKSE